MRDHREERGIMNILANTQIQQQETFLKDRKYYNPLWFIILGLFSPFLISAILFSINIGETNGKKVRNSYIIGAVIASTIFFILLYLVVPHIDAKSASIFASINNAICFTLYFMQKKPYKEWKANGGKVKSILIPVFITTILFILIIFSTIFPIQSGLKEYNIENSTIYYNSKIPEKEVIALGKFLSDVGLIKKGEISRFKLEIMNDEYCFIFPTKNEYLNSEQIKEFRDIFNLEINNKNEFSKKIQFFQSDADYNIVQFN